MPFPPHTGARTITGHALPVIVADGPTDVARALAREMVDVIRAARTDERAAVLGLATGRTPLALYREFARLVAAERLPLDALVTVQLDEYLDLPRAHPASFRATMRRTLFDAIGLPDSRAHFPVECHERDDLTASCARFEQLLVELGGVDWQVLGIGRNGHIAFNEPGSSADSRTRVVTLDETTRTANRSTFADDEEVPQRAVTMGIATIRAARRLRIVALGSGKAEIVHEFLHARAMSDLPATLLRDHPGAELWLDGAAAAEL